MAKEWRATGQEVPALKAFDEAMKAFMTQNGLPRAALAIGRGTSLMMARAYTWAEPTVELTQPTSLFRIASCTKPITSIAAYQLIEANALQLTERIQDILQLKAPSGADLPADDPQPANPATPGRYFRSIRIEHLLAHKPGLVREIILQADQQVVDALNAAAAHRELPVTELEMARWGATQQMKFWPGSAGQYTNFAFSLLGLAIERRTGLPLGQRMRDSIFTPLGITRARVVMPLERSRAAQEVDYVDIRPGPPLTTDLTGGSSVPVPGHYGGENHSNFGGFGGLVMAAPDLIRVLSAYSGANPPTTTHPRDMVGDWNLKSAGGVERYEHGGVFTPGTGAYIALRDDEVSIAAFFNADVARTFQWNGASRNHDDVWNDIATSIGAASWPTHDLFATVMTPAPAPGPERIHIFASDQNARIQEAAREQNVAAGTWLGWWDIRGGKAPNGAPVTALSRHKDKLDLFVIGQDGRVFTAAWEKGAEAERWMGWWSLAEGKGSTGAGVSAVARHPDNLDVFVTGTDGGVWTNAWVVGQDWAPAWRRIGGEKLFKSGTAIGVVSRGANMLDIFAVKADGKTYWAYWDAGVDPAKWFGWFPCPSAAQAGQAAPGAQFTAVSRHPEKVDVFVTGTDGGVWTTSLTGSTRATEKWDNAWLRIGAPSLFNQGSPVGAVARNGSKLDIFAVKSDGKIHWAWWDATANQQQWAGWFPCPPAPATAGQAAPASMVTAVSPNPERVDVFVTGTNGGVYTATLTGLSRAAQKWSGWSRVRDLQSTPGGFVGAVSRKLS